MTYVGLVLAINQLSILFFGWSKRSTSRVVTLPLLSQPVLIPHPTRLLAFFTSFCCLGFVLGIVLVPTTPLEIVLFTLDLLAYALVLPALFFRLTWISFDDWLSVGGIVISSAFQILAPEGFNYFSMHALVDIRMVSLVYKYSPRGKLDKCCCLMSASLSLATVPLRSQSVWSLLLCDTFCRLVLVPMLFVDRAVLVQPQTLETLLAWDHDYKSIGHPSAALLRKSLNARSSTLLMQIAPQAD
eukprot:c21716_g1_i1.p1 GENE.c21716_g1_i1~~c21716_g1_i1.p1  ORF type:complete len:252 (+),score=42.75 c21716_g1_i1:28-756(+)